LGHKRECKQLFIIEFLCKEFEVTLAESNTDPTISIHALIGIQPRSGRMMQVTVTINDTQHMTLLDLCSTHNFMERDVTKCIGLTLTDHVRLRVTVANGDDIHNPGYCHHLHMLIDGEDFVIDCYGLVLRS
jgi:hypothetical protein